VLKDLVFARWLAEGCEERSDTLKMVGGSMGGWAGAASQQALHLQACKLCSKPARGALEARHRCRHRHAMDAACLPAEKQVLPSCGIGAGSVGGKQLWPCQEPKVLRLSVQVGQVSFFLPFLPLERSHIRQLFEMRLAERSAELQDLKLGSLQWDPAVIDFLTSKVREEGREEMLALVLIVCCCTQSLSLPLLTGSGADCVWPLPQNWTLPFCSLAVPVLRWMLVLLPGI
jgi:hypothetical protein